MVHWVVDMTVGGMGASVINGAAGKYIRTLIKSFMEKFENAGKR